MKLVQLSNLPQVIFTDYLANYKIIRDSIRKCIIFGNNYHI